MLQPSVARTGFPTVAGVSLQVRDLETLEETEEVVEKAGIASNA